MTKCLDKDCNYDIFHEYEYCIFHCSKDDWFSIDKLHNINKKTIESKNWNIKLLEEFWEKFYEHIIFYKNCKKFIFPENECYLGEYFEKKDYFSDLKLDGFDFDKSDFKFCSEMTRNNLTNCTFRNAQFNYADFTFSKLENCNFHGSTFKNLNLSATNIKDTNFKWLNVAESANFMYSHIYNSYFDNSYINNFELENSVVKDISLQNIKVVKGDKHCYRILKEYHSKISDNILSNYYYSKEMQTYLKSIVLDPYYHIISITKNIRKQRFKNILNNTKFFFSSMSTFISDGLLLLWNFCVSNFGQNWFLPIFWLSFSSLGIFFYITPDKVFNINEFAIFLNPFTKSTDKFNDVYALWLLHKILETIFIYNFIIAIKRRTGQ